MIATTFDYESNSEELFALMDEKKRIEESDMNYCDKRNIIKGIINQMDNFIMKNLSQAVSKKYNIEYPTLGYLIEKFNSNALIIYNTDGFPIKKEKQIVEISNTK